MAQPEIDFYNCCQFVVDQCPNGYAKNYAVYGMKMRDVSADMQCAQALYILSNISRWKGETARRVRQSLRCIIEAYDMSN